MNQMFHLENIETAGPADAASKTAQILRVTNIELYDIFEDGFLDEIEGKLGAWCCVLRDGRAVKALYSYDRLPLVAAAQMALVID